MGRKTSKIGIEHSMSKKFAERQTVSPTLAGREAANGLLQRKGTFTADGFRKVSVSCVAADVRTIYGHREGYAISKLKYSVASSAGEYFIMTKN